MLEKEFSSIAKADIDALITNQVNESRVLDYKGSYCIQSESEKKEFLADICAFANTNGGHIIFGIEEQRDANNKPTGVPISALGIQDFNADAETLRIEEIIRNGLAPRLSGVLAKKIDGFANGPIFLVRIPQSWSSPHMVTFQTRPSFYSRNNSGDTRRNLNSK